MRSFTTPILMASAILGLATSQFSNGPGNFFSFSQGGGAAQTAPAFRPQQAQPVFRPQPQPAPVRQAAPASGGGGGCTPSPNYQSGNRNFWISWRGIYLDLISLRKLFYQDSSLTIVRSNTIFKCQYLLINISGISNSFDTNMMQMWFLFQFLQIMLVRNRQHENNLRW